MLPAFFLSFGTLSPDLHNPVSIFKVNEFLAGAGTDAPDVEDENITARPSMSYDDMWAKTLLETTEMVRSLTLLHALLSYI